MPPKDTTSLKVPTLKYRHQLLINAGWIFRCYSKSYSIYYKGAFVLIVKTSQQEVELFIDPSRLDLPPVTTCANLDTALQTVSNML